MPLPWMLAFVLPFHGLPLADISGFTAAAISRFGRCPVACEADRKWVPPSSRWKFLMGAGIAICITSDGCDGLPAHASSILTSSSCPSCRGLISFAALWITFHFRDEKKGIGLGKLAGAVVMGAAIPVMHYTVWPPQFHPSGTTGRLVSRGEHLHLGTAGIAAVILSSSAGLTDVLADRRFRCQPWNCRKRSCSEAKRTWRRRKDSRTREWPGGYGKGRLASIGGMYRIYGFDPENGPPALNNFCSVLIRRIEPSERCNRRESTRSRLRGEFRSFSGDPATQIHYSVGHPV